MKPTVRGGGTGERHAEPTFPDMAAIGTLAQRVHHTTRLARMALAGNDPRMGIDYLFDALDMLRDGLKDQKR